MMQHGIDRLSLLLCPVPGVITRMGIAHQPLWLKGVDLLHQRQCRPPLGLDTVVTEIAKVLAQHRLVTAHQTEGILHVGTGRQNGGKMAKTGG